MFDWVLNMPLKRVLKNSCFSKKLRKKPEKHLKIKIMNFNFPVKVKQHAENCIFIKPEFIQRYFAFVRNFLHLFGGTPLDDRICIQLVY